MNCQTPFDIFTNVISFCKKNTNKTSSIWQREHYLVPSCVYWPAGERAAFRCVHHTVLSQVVFTAEAFVTLIAFETLLTFITRKETTGQINTPKRTHPCLNWNVANVIAETFQHFHHAPRWQNYLPVWRAMCRFRLLLCVKANLQMAHLYSFFLVCTNMWRSRVPFTLNPCNESESTMVVGRHSLQETWCSPRDTQGTRALDSKDKGKHISSSLSQVQEQ